jgi:hypothetical protein
MDYFNLVVNMQNRDDIIEKALIDWGFMEFRRIKLPSDASFRKYEILETPEKTYILMDAPPEKEDVQPFIQKANLLIKMGLKAPKIYFQDIENGILLLENFGNKKFNAEVEKSKEVEKELYKNALDILAFIAYRSAPLLHLNNFIVQPRKQGEGYSDIPEYSAEILLNEALLYVDWHLKYTKKIEGENLEKFREIYLNEINKLTSKLHYKNEVFVLRDYHADNLMILEGHHKLNSLGLLDFQDGLIGNIAYDVVSLLEDARRVVDKNLQDEMIKYFCDIARLDFEKFYNDYCILGAIRNLKIIGIFTRLNYRDGKPHYLKLIPLVESYLQQDLEHKNCADLKNFLNAGL